MGDNPYLEIDRKMLGDIHTSARTMEHMAVLCDDFGSRFGGTEGERDAARFIRDRFKAYGLKNARLEPYRYASWARGETKLEIVSPVEREIPCIALPYCPSARIEAELVSVGLGAPSDFEHAGKTLKGKLVAASSQNPRGRSIHRSEKYSRSLLGGAAGFLFLNHYEGLGPATGSIADNREALIPGISIGKEYGDYLMRLTERHGTVKLRLTTKNRTREKTSWNVVAELPGKRTADEWVMTGCHYDGHDISQGALDPISGMAAILEAARVLALYGGERIGCGIRFIAFGTEEIGLIGAKEYVRAHADELDQIRLLFNMDSAGGPGRKGFVVHRRPELDAFFTTLKQQMAYDMPYGQGMSAFSDHFPFYEAGVPTCGMGDTEAVSTGRGFGHTAFDTLDKIRLADLREAASVLSRALLRASDAKTWPAKRKTKAQMAKQMKGDANLEILKVEAEVEKVYRRKRR